MEKTLISIPVTDASAIVVQPGARSGIVLGQYHASLYICDELEARIWMGEPCHLIVREYRGEKWVDAIRQRPIYAKTFTEEENAEAERVAKETGEIWETLLSTGDGDTLIAEVIWAMPAPKNWQLESIAKGVQTRRTLAREYGGKTVDEIIRLIGKKAHHIWKEDYDPAYITLDEVTYEVADEAVTCGYIQIAEYRDQMRERVIRQEAKQDELYEEWKRLTQQRQADSKITLDR